MKATVWIVWIGVSIGIAAYFGKSLFIDEQKEEFLIGEASHGHFQIELACETCHTSPFGGQDVLQDACVNCHAEELEAAHDSHPKKKFTDPREAYRIKILDARYCVSCHTEHQKEQTHAMGVSLPDDYCYHCHKEVGDDRESHKDLPFDSCASAGCHNFHDNRALYEAFLVENAGQPWLKEIAKISLTNATESLKKETITLSSSKFSNEIASHPDIAQHWDASSHAQSGVDCGGCHQATGSDWIEKPGIKECSTCHKQEATTYTQGKHGMRLSDTLSASLPAISPGESELEFKESAHDLQHGCNTCHGAHEFNPQQAVVESCLNCHADEHSTSFKQSPHGALWEKAIAGEIPQDESVTCATCHMPKLDHPTKPNVRFVNHNQNDNLRPNEKMIRPVCMQCHGLEFSIDALADPLLIKNNFKGTPGTHIESVDWAVKREQRD